jgi:hypothetical protein
MDIFTGIFALVIGLVALWFSVKTLRTYFKVKKWSRVKANVISSGTSLHKKYSTRNTPYKVDASYNYDFNGREFTNDKVFLIELLGGQMNHMLKDAERRAAKIKGEISIFVDPMDPARSVIYCNGVGIYIVAFLMGFFSIIFGIAKFA